ncbi:uncharacterized protein LOC131941998 [Physella acuta]|uniref:uncharacterized protein LOC131941998 n=1 Tax=Physella acuta TaxID=109671 RepID=UPI0027DD772C|nr:uncharacterized protein LOC131941998 [Physella acuta]
MMWYTVLTFIALVGYMYQVVNGNQTLATRRCCNHDKCIYVNYIGYNTSKNTCHSFGGRLVNVTQLLENCSDIDVGANDTLTGNTIVLTCGWNNLNPFSCFHCQFPEIDDHGIEIENLNFTNQTRHSDIKSFFFCSTTDIYQTAECLNFYIYIFLATSVALLVILILVTASCFKQKRKGETSFFSLRLA